MALVHCCELASSSLFSDHSDLCLAVWETLDCREGVRDLIDWFEEESVILAAFGSWECLVRCWLWVEKEEWEKEVGP